MRTIRLALAAALAAGGLALTAAPAMAATCTAPGCDESAQVQVQASITMALTPTSFSFNGGQPVLAGQQVGPAGPNGVDYVGAFTSDMPAGNAAAHYTAVITTGDDLGYSITGAATPFTSGAQSLPLSALTVYNVLSGSTTWAAWHLTGTAQTIASSGSHSATGGDPWFFNDALQIPDSARNGAFTATLSYVALAN